jgi:hypothetical protein
MWLLGLFLFKLLEDQRGIDPETFQVPSKKANLMGQNRPQSKQGGSSSPDTDSHLIWWQDLLQHFRSVQEKHEKNRKVAVRPFPAMEKTQAKHRSSRGSRILASSGQSEESGSDTVPPKEKRVSSLGFGTKFSTKGSSSQSASMRGLSRKA